MVNDEFTLGPIPERRPVGHWDHKKFARQARRNPGRSVTFGPCSPSVANQINKGLISAYPFGEFKAGAIDRRIVQGKKIAMISVWYVGTDQEVCPHCGRVME